MMLDSARFATSVSSVNKNPLFRLEVRCVVAKKEREKGKEEDSGIGKVACRLTPEGAT